MKNTVLKKAIINMVGVFGIAALSSSLQAASFDCVKASTKIEKMICADENLSVLDEQLAAAYKSSVEKSADKDSVKQYQRAWLKKVRDFCATTECLVSAYKMRIPELIIDVSPQSLAEKPSPEAMAAAAKPVEIPENKRIENQKLPLTFKLVEGDSYPICQPYVDMLNKTKYMEYPACERKLLPEYEQYKALDWIEVTDMKEKLKAVEDGITMEYASLLGLDNPTFKNTLKEHLKLTSEKNTPMFKTVLDMDGDGNKEIIYNRLNISPNTEATNNCKRRNYFYVVDSTVTVENAKQYRRKGYRAMSLDGDNQLFLINNTVYQSHWSGRSHNGDMAIYSLQNGHIKICGIDIQ